MYQTAAGRAAASEKEVPIELLVKSRGSPLVNLPGKTYAVPSDPCSALYERIAAKSRAQIARIRITKGSDGALVPNDPKVTIDQLGLYEQNTIHVKDLGPQIAWQTVFIVEYIGPIILHPLMLLLRPTIYHSHRPLSSAQYLSFVLIVGHFLKREYETLFVHRFSNSTMPIMNIFKNSAHYWLLAGLNIALCTYSPASACPTANAAPYWWWNTVAVVLYAVGELGNFSTHLQLRDLRSQGGKERGIPMGGVFDIVPVTCPNYFFETLAWAAIWMVNRSLSTGLFLVVAAGQMAVWGRKKERRYRKEFGSDYPKKRFAMLPGIV